MIVSVRSANRLTRTCGHSCPICLLAIETLEETPGVVIKATDDGQVQLDKFCEAAPLKLAEKVGETGHRSGRCLKEFSNIGQGELKRMELAFGHLRILTLKF